MSSMNISKTTGLSKIAYDHILNLILTNQLVPGAHIKETKISQDLNISRTPVRDAIFKLSEQGLIDLNTNHFAKVSIYSPEMICEIGTLRLFMDQLAIKLALLFGSHADFLKLQQLAQKCIGAYNTDDIFTRRSLDSDFHMELARISKNNLLVDIHNSLYLKVLFIQLYYINPSCDMHEQVVQHMELSNALLSHDAKAAFEIGKNHLISFYNLNEFFPQSFFSDKIMENPVL